MEIENISSISNSVLSSTLHDVAIEHVEIINPSSTSVKFQVGIHQNSSTNFNNSQKLSSFLNEQDYKSQPEKATTENELDIKQQKATVQFSDYTTLHDVNKLQIQTCPLQSNISPAVDAYYRHENDEKINLNKAAKQKLKEELFHKQQQLFESVNRNDRRHSAKKRDNSTRFYEVAPGVVVPERPLSRIPHNFEITELIRTGPYVPPHQNRAATVPGAGKDRVWTGHRSAASSRAISSVSSRWRMEDLAQSRPNIFVKMPFKQIPVATMEYKTKPSEDDILLPGDDLRATTAFALSRLRHGLRRMSPPSKNGPKPGRLLKARLAPMQPVKIKGPQISLCRGVQPEVRKEVTNSPSPSRLRELKEQYLEKCQTRNHTLVREEYKRRRNAHSAASDQSIHRTSPQPDDDNRLDSLPVYLDPDFPCTEKSDVDIEFPRNPNEYLEISNQINAININSEVIY